MSDKNNGRKPRKLKNGASYNKVCSLLMETMEFKQEMKDAERRLETARISECKFHSDWGGRSFGSIVLTFGDEESKTIEKELDCQYDSPTVSISKSDYILKSSFDKVVDANFGVTKPGFSKPSVPTYFLSKERVKEHLWDNFQCDRFYSLIDKTKARLQSQASQIYQSDEFKAGLVKAREDYTVQEICKTLAQFKDASPATLRRACEHFIIETIMTE